MTNVIYDNTALDTALYATKVDVKPVTNATRQVAAADLNRLRTAFDDTRKIINGLSFNVMVYGATGDGSTDDAAAFIAAIAAAQTQVASGAYGIWVDVPKGVYILGTKLELPNGVGLRGMGPTASVLRAKSTFSGTSLVTNADHAGTQEFCFLEGLQIDGNEGNGAVCSVAVVDLVSLFINSYMNNCVVLEGSNVGLRVAGVNGMGPVFFLNNWVVRNNGHNVLVEEVVGNTHGLNGLYFVNLASEHQGTNSSALYLKGLGHSQQWNFHNIHIEQGATGATGRSAITIDGVSHVLIDGVQLEADLATVSNGIVITNVVQNVGIQIRGVTNQNLINPVILDQKNSVTIGAVNVPYYCTPDVNFRGAPRFTPDSTTGAKSISFQSSALVDRAWFDDLGQLTGSSQNGAGLDVVGSEAVTNDRALTIVNNAKTRVYGWNFPVGGGGVSRFRYITGGVDIMQFGTDGSVFHYQAATFQLAPTFQSGFINSAGTRNTNEITPTQLTANVDNYAPTGFSTAYAIILTSDASRDITGFASPTTGRRIFVYNNGAQNIVLKHDVTSTAANRIFGRGAADTTLTPKTGVILYYSASITRWIIEGDSL